MTSQTYIATLDGFEGSFASVAELKAWAEKLIRRYPDLIGKTCKVWASSTGVFSPKPTREIVIGA